MTLCLFGTPKGTNGLYGTNAAAFAIWNVSNPNGAANTNQLVVSLSQSGVTDPHYTYSWTNVSGIAQWQLTDTGGVRTVSSWKGSESDPTYGTVTNLHVQTLSGGITNHQTKGSYALIAGTNAMTRMQKGSEPATNITTYSHSGSSLPQRIDYPDGRWEYFVYDSKMRVATNYSAYLNYSPPASGQPNPLVDHCKEIDYFYTAQITGDDTNIHPALARLEVVSLPVSVGGTWYLKEVSRTYRSAPVATEVDEYRCPVPGAASSNSDNLITKTARCWDQSNTNAYGRIMWQIFPDGTATINTYQTNSSGLLTNILEQTGVPNNTTNPTAITEGMQASTAYNSLGQVTLRKTQAITNSALSFVLSQETYYYSGNLNENVTVVDLAGRTNQYNYACCGLESTVDPDGVTTTYEYDVLRRQVSSTVLRGAAGIKTTNTLDAAGRVLVTQRIGTDGSVITLNQNQYDMLGQLVSQTNALGGVSTYTNRLVSNQSCSTNTYPDGGTRAEVRYRDGRLQSISGSAIFPVQYQYGIEQDGDTNAPWREFTLTVKLDSGGGTNEWTKTYTDGVGRPYKTIYAAASGAPFSISYFNNQGQLTNQVDVDGVYGASMLYIYNAKGEQTYSVVDMDGDHIVDFAAGDRITFTSNDVATAHSANVRRTQVFVWSTGANASNLISTAETSTDGLKSWNTTWNAGLGVMNQSSTVYSAGTNRFVTNTAPDNSYSVAIYRYGQLRTNTQYDANNSQIGRTSYDYDAHGRLNLVTDARTGTTTNWFNSADQVSGTATPASGTGQPSELTTNYFDSLGRIWKATLPDGTSVTNKYDVTGLLTNTFGSRTFPVAYTFDAQGRMKTMTTWKSFAAGSGAAATTWNYDIYRGRLTNKAYADGKGPTYTYTAGGHVATRTWARGTNTQYHYYAGDLLDVYHSDLYTPNFYLRYDRRGRLNLRFDGVVLTTLTYNDAGQVLTQSYAGNFLNGISITNAYGYDHLLRRTNLVVLANGAPLTGTTNNFDAASLLLTISDGTNSGTYTYLANSPLVSQIDFKQNGTTRMTTTKSYDNLNRLTSIVSSTNAVAVASFKYGYNSANQRTTVTNVDNSYWVYAYDGLGQVVSGKKYWSDGTPVAGQQFQYGFDDIGNRTTTAVGGDQWGANLRYAGYAANNLNQYTSRTVPGAVDVIGTATNTATVTVNNTPAYRKANYYRAALSLANTAGPVWQSVTNLAILNNGSNPDIVTNANGNVYLPQTPETFSYDPDGNLTNDGRWQYTWDGENRLVTMQSISTLPTAAKLKLDFLYDWQGRRIQKIVSTNNGSAYYPLSTNRFVYDGWNLTCELGATNNNVSRAYMWGLDLSGSPQGAGGVGGMLVVSQSTSNTTQFACYDGNGNVAALADTTSAAVTGQYEYGPFGEVIRAAGLVAKGNPLRFSTKYEDDETDLLYYGYRYCKPSAGGWLSRDALGERGFELIRSDEGNPKLQQGEANLYLFASNDGLSKFDYLGLDPNIARGTTFTVNLQGGGKVTVTVGSHFSQAEQDTGRRGLCLVRKLLGFPPYLPPFSDTYWATFTGTAIDGLTHEREHFHLEYPQANALQFCFGCQLWRPTCPRGGPLLHGLRRWPWRPWRQN